MRLLIIEDDVDFGSTLAFWLEQENIRTDICADGADALSYINENVYDIILLDRMLPHTDGITLLKKIRRQGNTTPVIILTALGETKDRVTGLDSGADDYLVKPFDFEELTARIRCIRRRPAQYNDNSTLTFSDISYDADSHRLSGPLGSCTLSRTEGALFDVLIRTPGQTLSRDTIIARVWGPFGSVEDGNLDNFIHFVRRRLKHVSPNVAIETIRGIGYRLVCTSDKPLGGISK